MLDLDVHAIPCSPLDISQGHGKLDSDACEGAASLCIMPEACHSCSPLESSRGHGSLESNDGKTQSLPAELLRSSCSASAFEQDAQALRLHSFYDAHGLPGADMTGLRRLSVTRLSTADDRRWSLSAELLCPSSLPFEQAEWCCIC